MAWLPLIAAYYLMKLHLLEALSNAALVVKVLVWPRRLYGDQVYLDGWDIEYRLIVVSDEALVELAVRGLAL